MSYGKLLLRISVFVVLFCVVTSVGWGKNCKQVNVVRIEGSVCFFDDPETCNGYDACCFQELYGTPNGTFKQYAYWDDLIPVGGDTVASLQDAIIETAKGELYLKESVIVDWGAIDGWAEHIRVVGGTGEFEGATGWMVGYGDLEVDFIRYAGEICYAEKD